ncbi:hypothetical protein P4O66_000286 [Electrophorus voltai]|uniref:Molybdopterin synthase sulfur carrier subunit n=1 Tax=Electrophorus voltai TaxID=2609070 RepID=A0AAD8ZMM8_9TELE|nr:hypothetical protein P4O66_000286 [Electrophorus voltai]
MFEIIARAVKNGKHLLAVSVLYFAKSAELAGVKSETLCVRADITSIQLWQELEKRHPKLLAVREQVVLAVRQEYVALGEQRLSLSEGDEVAVIPPLSGGVVPITETSVIIAVSSPHRHDSLEAVKYCIDTLKATVPIWKKEIYESEEPCWKENKECKWAESRLKSKAS